MNILDRIQESPMVFDGAMGTMIYGRGFFLNVCYDELCLKVPQMITQIHAEYVAAGAEVLESNTFGANRIKLQAYGLAEQTAEINRAGVRLAREAAGEAVFVAGAVGPCLKNGQPLTAGNSVEIRAAFAEQCGALAEAGADFILLETFANVAELQMAAEAAWSTGKPVHASFTVNDEGETALGSKVEEVVSILDQDSNVDIIGINCGVGPAGLYEVVERALQHTHKPVVVMPNAGLPRSVDGRMMYLSNPEYFTEYAKKFIELGVRGIGGCCGTTPEHIRVMARAIKTLSGVKRHIEVKAWQPDEKAPVTVVPPSRKSRFANRLLAGEKVTSIEILPPKSSDLTVMLDKARTCHIHGIDAINIPDGPRASSRVSPMVAAIAIKDRVGIEPVLHYCCRDRNLIGMQSDLLGGYAAGLSNFLIITGDPPKLGDYPDATGVFDVDSIGLTQVATNLNNGRDIGGSPISPPTGIFIGVGANPCAVEPAREIERYHEKIDAGAEYSITQPIFDPEALFRFLDEANKHARPIPVLAGVWPLISYKNAEFMRNEVPGVTVPDWVMERMSHCQSKEDGRRMGIEIAQEICDAIVDRVNGFQVSAPFGNVDIALAVLRK